MPDDFSSSPKLSGLAQMLRARILELPEGTMIGQESDLMEGLGCTRAMLRQACRLLEFQGLLTVRRGPKGGYFGARPSPDTVVEAAAIYLEAKSASLEDALRATNTFTAEAMRLACDCPAGHPARRHLSELRDELRTKFPEDMDAIEFAEDDGRIDEVIYEMVSNEPLELFIKILNRMSTHEFGQRIFVRHPERRVHFRKLRFDLIDALLISDANAASEAMAALNRCIVLWMPIDDDAKAAIVRAA